jgi:hypothetical protein
VNGAARVKAAQSDRDSAAAPRRAGRRFRG